MPTLEAVESATTLDPRAMPIAALAVAIRVQAQHYRNGEAADDSFALELFRRAALDAQPAAWEELVSLYRPHVLACLKRHPAWPDRREPEDDFWVMQVFQRFWSATRSDRLRNFHTLGAILAYLKLCVHSVLLDEARGPRAMPLHALDGELEIPDSRPDVAAQVVGKLSSKMVWQMVLSEAQGEQEPVVARLSWVRGMRPAEIYAAKPALFASVDDVYRIKRNLLMRLRRSPQLADLLA
jgi:hypothetical protein